MPKKVNERGEHYSLSRRSVRALRSPKRPRSPIDKVPDPDAKPFLVGYREAYAATGIPVKRLQRMVYAKRLRVIKSNEGSVIFDRGKLFEDLSRMERKAIEL